MKKKFTKPAQTARQLLDRFKTRGLLVADEDTALHYLEYVGGYRLKGFWYHLVDPTTKRFLNQTTFQHIVDRYEFDRQLRGLAFDAVGRLEVGIRCTVSNVLSKNHGPHWFMTPSVFRPDANFGLGSLLRTTEDAVKRSSKTQFIAHYNRSYEEPYLPPSWGITECVTFGFWSQIYRIIRDKHDKNEISGAFAIKEPEVFASWLHCLTYVRNLTCHHGRLLKATLVISPKKYKKDNIKFPQPNRFHAHATVINVLLTRTQLPTTWRSDLRTLFDRYPHIDPHQELGFEPGWDQKPGWCSSPAGRFPQV